jgi:FkbM family methyltransferase
MNKSINNNSKFVKEFCDRFINSNLPKFVFGTNSFAKEISDLVEIDGFINDLSTVNTFNDKPVYQLNNIPVNSLIVSAVVLAKPTSVLNKIRTFPVQAIDYFAFRAFSGLKLPQVIFKDYDSFADELAVNESYYSSLRSNLADDDSIWTFDKIVNFRITSDITFLEGFEYNVENQYFEGFLELSTKGEVFLDVGCFDGFTTEQFIKRCSEYGGIHVFEPDENNLPFIHNRLSKFERINYHNFGLSDESATYRFISDGSAARISETGDSKIEVRPLDDLNLDAVTYIKMDIEGAELQALRGARNTILKNHPRIAVSVYHKVDDFRIIPNEILSIRNDYRIYLRHYTEGVIETVMFFIPVK